MLSFVFAGWKLAFQSRNNIQLTSAWEKFGTLDDIQEEKQQDRLGSSQYQQTNVSLYKGNLLDVLSAFSTRDLAIKVEFLHASNQSTISTWTLQVSECNLETIDKFLLLSELQLLKDYSRLGKQLQCHWNRLSNFDYDLEIGEFYRTENWHIKIYFVS